MRWMQLFAITIVGVTACSQKAKPVEESAPAKHAAKQTPKAAEDPSIPVNQADWTFRKIDPKQYHSQIVVLDAATPGKTPTDNGWGLYMDGGSGRMIYLEGGERGSYLRLFSKDVGKMGNFILGDFPYDETRNPNDNAFKTVGFDMLTLYVKNNSAKHSPFQLWVICDIDGKGRQLQFQSKNGKASASAGARTFFLGPGLNDGQWHLLELDLTGFLQKLNPNERITAINGLRVVAEDLYVDDIKLTMLEPLNATPAAK